MPESGPGHDGHLHCWKEEEVQEMGVVGRWVGAYKTEDYKIGSRENLSP